MRVGTLPLNAQAAVAAALLSVSLTMAPPALADVDYQGSKIGQDKQIESAKGYGAERAENSKIQGGGARRGVAKTSCPRYRLTVTRVKTGRDNHGIHRLQSACSLTSLAWFAECCCRMAQLMG